ncbi:unnamed protein product [Blepharisma stoltei]|uniref:non-specific serine/threonine protein kinase n=1 Tax=Blepharisma stoltei TaxID=1481888 RepID=A0AAU9IG27_9CILI|nr:unnamed protein product [Blepharisma stoltei]
MAIEHRHQISIEDFNLLSVIGKGSYGKVLLVRKRDTQQVYAMKILKKKHLAAKNQIEHTRTERSILERIRHPYIVKLCYAFQNAQKLYFVLDYCPGGELFFHLNHAKRFDEERARFYAGCIILALEHLHKNDIVYRDLKPENVLIDAEGFAKITDFGLSKENIVDNTSARTFCGTPEYLAPEILLRQGHGQAVDWWSLGCIIYEMLTGLPPFYMNHRPEMRRKILSEEIKYSPTMSAEVKDLLQGLLQKDPEQRLGSGDLGADEIKTHPWFTTLDWFLLENKLIQPPFVPNVCGPADIKYFSREFTNSPARDSVCFDSTAQTGACSPTYDGFSFTASPPSQNPLMQIEENSNSDEYIFQMS